MITQQSRDPYPTLDFVISLLVTLSKPVTLSEPSVILVKLGQDQPHGHRVETKGNPGYGAQRPVTRPCGRPPGAAQTPVSAPWPGLSVPPHWPRAVPTCRISVPLWGLFFVFFLSSCNITPSLGLERNVFLRTGPWFPTDLLFFVFFLFFFFSLLFSYLFWAVVGLHCYTGVFSSCGEQELLSSCRVRASRCIGFSCRGALALGHESRSTCGPWAQSSQLPGSRAQA